MDFGLQSQLRRMHYTLLGSLNELTLMKLSSEKKKEVESKIREAIDKLSELRSEV